MVTLDYPQYVKSQVSKPDWELLQNIGVNLDTRVIAELWPAFVNYQKRVKTEVPFLLKQLSHVQHPKVFNACLGAGTTTFGLAQARVHDIISNEIDSEYRRISKQEAKRFNIPLSITTYDWRALPDKWTHTFDAVLCLGNSLTLLFKKKDQLRTLCNFRKVLRPGGKLIIDERNYAGQILAGEYRHSGAVVYCGKKRVPARPMHISESMVVMEYPFKEKRERAHLVLYPFKKGEMKKLLKEAGFKDITAYGDYKKKFNPKTPEFITYVGRK